MIKNHPRLNILFIFMFLCLLRMKEAATSYCSMENTSLDPAKCRPYLEALMYNMIIEGLRGQPLYYQG